MVYTHTCRYKPITTLVVSMRCVKYHLTQLVMVLLIYFLNLNNLADTTDITLLKDQIYYVLKSSDKLAMKKYGCVVCILLSQGTYRHGCLFVYVCTIDAAVADLRKLEEDITQLSNTVQGDDDLLQLSHLVHTFTHRLCRTLEESKAACNRAPPEQGDGKL